jgi:hypothetical protein
VLFDAARPVILNGIEDMVASAGPRRSWAVPYAEAIPENRRKPEAELSAAFEASGRAS